MVKKSIALIIKSLTCGGAERVLVDLAQGFVDAGYSVTVITTDNRIKDHFTLPTGVDRYELGNWHANNNPLIKNIWLIRQLRQCLRDISPDFAISFVHMINIRCVIASLGLTHKVIVTEHTSPVKAPLSPFWRIARRITYSYSHFLVCVSQGVSAGFSWMKQRAVIYNPVSLEPLPPNTSVQNQVVGAVGRLHPAKGFDILIHAFSGIANEFPNWTLRIFGEGAEREHLESIIEKTQVKDKIEICGFSSNIAAAYATMDIFVLSSRYEGMGLVLAEAQLAGVPCISFDCPSGPSEIITHNEDGILVKNGDATELQQALGKLMDSPEQRMQLAAAGRQSAQRFSLSTTVNQWISLFNKLSKNDL